MTSFGTRRLAALATLAAALSFGQSVNEELHEAARAGDAAKVKALLDKGADVNAKGLYDQTPIFFAADRGHVEVVRLLIDRGANLNAKDSFYNMTPLSRAAMKNRTDVVKLMLDKGAPGAGQLLFQAVATGNKDGAKMLLESGKLTPKELTSALQFATSQKKPEFVEMLTAAGAKPPAPATFAIPSEELAQYAGTYQGGRAGSEFEATLAVADGKLKATLQGQTLTFAASSKTEFRGVEQEALTLEFKMQDGKPAGFTLMPANREFTRKPESK